MTKCIERPALIGELTSAEMQKKMRGMTGSDAYFEFLRMVIETPAADVAPVKRGKWEYNKDAADWGIGGYVCSVCRNKNNNLPCNRVKTVRVFSGVAYCPNCGAKMDEED